MAGHHSKYNQSAPSHFERLHTILSDDPEFTALAQEHSITLTDYRRIQPESEVVAKGTWRNRSARVILTVGTDCNIGKMTSMLEVHKDLLRRGLRTDFVATGQTGMMIRGGASQSIRSSATTSPEQSSWKWTARSPRDTSTSSLKDRAR